MLKLDEGVESVALVEMFADGTRFEDSMAMAAHAFGDFFAEGGRVALLEFEEALVFLGVAFAEALEPLFESGPGHGGIRIMGGLGMEGGEANQSCENDDERFHGGSPAGLEGAFPIEKFVGEVVDAHPVGIDHQGEQEGGGELGEVVVGKGVGEGVRQVGCGLVMWAGRRRFDEEAGGDGKDQGEAGHDGEGATGRTGDGERGGGCIELFAGGMEKLFTPPVGQGRDGGRGKGSGEIADLLAIGAEGGGKGEGEGEDRTFPEGKLACAFEEEPALPEGGWGEGDHGVSLSE